MATMKSSPPTLDFFALTSALLGGVCLLTYSLGVMSKALRAALGDGLRSTIRAATSNRVVGFITGTLVTALLTSATASSLLVVQFVQAGDMTFAQSLGVCLGINVGSTLNAHLIAYSLSRYALAMIACGYLVSVVGALPAVWRNIGEAVFGLGLLFQAGAIISGGIAPLKAYPPFLEYLLLVAGNPLLAMVASGLAAIVFQSSNTVIAVAIMLAQQGLLSLDSGVSLVMGANIGEPAAAEPRSRASAGLQQSCWNRGEKYPIANFFIPEYAELHTVLACLWNRKMPCNRCVAPGVPALLITSPADTPLASSLPSGTCFTAIIASCGKRRETVRVAWSYLLLKTVGVILLWMVQPLFLSALAWITTAARKRAEEAAYDRIIEQGECTMKNVYTEHGELLLLWKRAVEKKSLFIGYRLCRMLAIMFSLISLESPACYLPRLGRLNEH